MKAGQLAGKICKVIDLVTRLSVEVWFHTNPFAMLTQHWLPFLILGGFISMIFIPNMLKKDSSLSRYSEFDDYKNRSGLLLPKLFLMPVSKQQEKTVI
ncbi:hypothetical protein [uncultured Nostoc sp.]|uniref:hypothetical protein n=1 Tax=uncultured Nostoc sp. TaxID=340711 RepID=UPI0035CA4E90